MKFEISSKDDGELLAEFRAVAMKESLEAVGRFCPFRVKDRFLSGFIPENTTKVTLANDVVAFYAVIENSDHLYLDHLYVHPAHQKKKIGTVIINRVLELAKEKRKVVKLGALKESKANHFYLSHGFVKTHEEEFDNYYTIDHRNIS